LAVYKEIVTKAVIGKGKKSFSDVYTITSEIVPTTVLGCWVINHNFKGYPNSGKIIIDGSFDVNIWYSYDNDTKTNVISKKITYSNTSTIKLKDNSEITPDTEVIVRSLKQPTCSKVEIVDGNISFTIEKELGIEIIGDTKVKILVEDEEEPWDVINDEVDEQIDKEVNENFIK
jgi:spore coat protein E